MWCLIAFAALHIFRLLGICIMMCCFSRLCFASFYRMSGLNKEVYHEAPSSSSSSDDDIMNKPIKFSTSGANQHHAYDTFFQESNAPWYQIHCVTGSIAVFLLYFCVFREENDIDEELGRTLWRRIPPLQEQSLLSEIRTGQLAGTDVSELEKELDQLYKKYS